MRAADLLQQAGQASIAADWRYRDWLRARDTCLPGARAPAEARAADARATGLKRRFVAVFNPLARRVGLRVWRAAQF